MANQYKKINYDSASGGGGGGAGDAINIDYDGASSGLSANNVQSAIDELVSKSFVPRPLITLSAGDITAGSVSLIVTPTSGSLTRLTVGGVRQQYGTDFIVSGSTLSWSGLGLDGILESGDVLQIELK
jgi:hypothetical protein